MSTFFDAFKNLDWSRRAGPHTRLRSTKTGATSFDDLRGQFAAAQKANDAERDAKRAEAKKSIESWKTVFNAIFPGAGDTLMWAYGVFDSLGSVLVKSDANSQENVDRAQEVLKALADYGVEPSKFSPELYVGAKDYADAHQAQVSRFDEANAFTRDALRLTRTWAIEFAGTNAYKDLMGLDWTYSIGSPQSAMKIGLLAALANGTDIDCVQKRAYEAWVHLYRGYNADGVTAKGAALAYEAMVIAALDAAGITVPSDTRPAMDQATLDAMDIALPGFSSDPTSHKPLAPPCPKATSGDASGSHSVTSDKGLSGGTPSPAATSTVGEVATVGLGLTALAILAKVFL